MSRRLDDSESTRERMAHMPGRNRPPEGDPLPPSPRPDDALNRQAVTASNSHAVLAEQLARTRLALRSMVAAVEADIRNADILQSVALSSALSYAKEMLGTP